MAFWDVGERERSHSPRHLPLLLRASAQSLPVNCSIVCLLARLPPGRLIVYFCDRLDDLKL